MGSRLRQLPSAIALNCFENCKVEATALEDVCTFESIGLVEGMLDKIEGAHIVLLYSLQFLPRAAQKKLSSHQLILCLGSAPDTRAIESALADELGLRMVHLDNSRADEIADSVMALVLGLLRKTHVLAAQGCTSASWFGGFRSPWLGMQRLRGKVLGLIGINASGRALARRAQAFGMKIIYFDVEKDMEGPLLLSRAGISFARNARAVGSLEKLLEQSDVISMHCTLADGTVHLINLESAKHFKKGSLLVNVSSCHLVDDSAVKWALNEKILGNCALDGVEGPQWMEAWVREFPNVLILPRSADHSEEISLELRAKAVAAIRSFVTLGSLPEDLIEDDDAVEALLLEAEERGREREGLGVRNLGVEGAGKREGRLEDIGEGDGVVSEDDVEIEVGEVADVEEADVRGLGGKRFGEVGGGSKGGRRSRGSLAMSGEGGKVGVGVRFGMEEEYGGMEVEEEEEEEEEAERGEEGGEGGEKEAEGHVVLAHEKGFGSEDELEHVVIAESLQVVKASSRPLLADGTLVAFRSRTSPKRFYAARRKHLSRPWELVLTDDVDCSHPSAQFVVVCDNELLGCRSLVADGKFLQASENGGMVFVNEDLDVAESWFFQQVAGDKGVIRLTNAVHEKVQLEVFIVPLVSQA